MSVDAILPVFVALPLIVAAVTALSPVSYTHLTLPTKA
mgnify:CR=1 FL=1